MTLGYQLWRKPWPKWNAVKETRSISILNPYRRRLTSWLIDAGSVPTRLRPLRLISTTVLWPASAVAGGACAGVPRRQIVRYDLGALATPRPLAVLPPTGNPRIGARLFVALQHVLPQHGLSRLVYAATRSRRRWFKAACCDRSAGPRFHTGANILGVWG